MADLRNIIKGIAGLKPIPQIVNKILEIQQDQESSMDDLTKVISHDAMTTANLLKAANSAIYARPKPFESVQQAAVFLGMDEIVDLVLISQSPTNLKRPQKGYGLEAGELWRNGVASALISRELSHKLNLANPHLVFTSALLKDIGKVVLEQYVDACAKEINTLVAQGSHSFEEAEKSVIGIDHAELGGMTARVWRFSPEMVDIIKHHHQPGRADLAPKEAAVVHLSDAICMMMGIGTGADGLAYHFDQQLIETMGLTYTDLQDIMVGFSEKIEEIENLIALN
jgi:putative nucleotidyltransferase with HDIG domain